MLSAVQTSSITEYELFEIVDSGSKRTQTVKVMYFEGGSMRVAGPKGDLDHAIAHNSFPGRMLGSVGPKQEPYAWPEFSQMTVYRDLPQVMCRTTDRMEDLADLLGWHVEEGGLTIYLGISTISHKWPLWTDAKLKEIENLIRYDLGFDGFKVKIQRHTPTVNKKLAEKYQLGSDEFLWKLTIHNA